MKLIVKRKIVTAFKYKTIKIVKLLPYNIFKFK